MIPSPAQWVKDPALLQRDVKPAAVAQIRSLVWERPYATVQPKKKAEDKKVDFSSAVEEAASSLRKAV